MRVWDDPRPKPSRFRGSLGLALLLHVAFWFAPTTERSGTAFGATAGPQLDSLLISLEPPAPDRAAPGGGSPVPDQKAPTLAAPKRVSVKPAPRIAPPKTISPELESEPTAENEDVPSSAFDLLAALDAPTTVLAKAGPRKVLLGPRSTSTTSSHEARPEPTPGRYEGSGSGAHGGPGGRGAGAGAGGVVTRAFAFGGPTGAFRAEVCAIRRGTRSVKEVTSCPLLATFFTNRLDVPPRGFSEGFPGVTDRTEWFAIRYRGKFTVKAGDYYRFRLVSDDGAILYIDGYPVVDNDGQHPPVSRQATIQLEAGEHELFVSYYQGPRDNLALQLFVKGSDGPERLFGPAF
jgi:hypothetical protein